jgi:hypothetical protein
MRTFAQRPKANQEATADGATKSRASFGQCRWGNSVLSLQRTIGNRAAHQLLQADVESLKVGSGTAPRLRSGHDFSRVWVPSGRTTLPEDAEEETGRAGPGPVSQSLKAGGPWDAAVSLPGGLPTPAKAAPVTPPSPPAAPCTIATKTLAAAPDGKADTRKQVGVNEQVEMTASASAIWKASKGSLTPPSGGTVAIWTAPGVGATASVTATPAKGAPCSVRMTVLAPARRSLVKKSDRAYTAGLAGSGFQATVAIMPTSVSFTRIEVWEGAVNAVASGYYDKVLRWNGSRHPPTDPLIPDANNNGLIDTIGTPPPGSAARFSVGRFSWPIPQHYRIVGSAGGGVRYSRGHHIQVMTGTNGAESTAKEGASRGRVP